jgi:hypothetical protein
MYNFHKIREGQSESYFYHELFDRNNMYCLNLLRHFISEIKRKPEKKKRKGEDQEFEDDVDDNVSLYRNKKKFKSYDIFNPREEMSSRKPSIENIEKKHPEENTLHLVGSEHDPLLHGNRMLSTERNILSMEL